MTQRAESMNQLFAAILSLRDQEECCRFFEDICTVRELQDMAQRYAVAKMLWEKKSYLTISAETGMSTATISRVNRSLTYGSGGYQMAIEREMEGKGNGDQDGYPEK